MADNGWGRRRSRRGREKSLGRRIAAPDGRRWHQSTNTYRGKLQPLSRPTTRQSRDGVTALHASVQTPRRRATHGLCCQPQNQNGIRNQLTSSSTSHRGIRTYLEDHLPAFYVLGAALSAGPCKLSGCWRSPLIATQKRMNICPYSVICGGS